MAPQAVGSVARLRRRFWKPLPQYALHSPQSAHELHFPSMHSPLHGIVLQKFTSSLSSAWQGRPPFRGAVSTALLRRMEPPPQVFVQSLQSNQLPHLQSTTSCGLIWQAWSSTVVPLQALPSPVAGSRLRILLEKPSPVSWEHSLQSLQSPKTQSLVTGTQA